ncbi:MAG: hypothetical protein FJZ56_00810 [Chlamydiae bacterium]|nr:hypothetical protein [Chlamydiota bacterium]
MILLKKLLVNLFFLSATLPIPQHLKPYSVASLCPIAYQEELEECKEEKILFFADKIFPAYKVRVYERIYRADLAEVGSIYYVMDENGKKLCVIKRSKKEIEALQYLEKKKFSSFNTPKIILIEDDLVAITIAKGYSLNSYLKKLSSSSIESRKKMEPLLLHIVKKTQLALDEIHTKTTRIHGDMNPGNIFYDPLTDEITLIDWEFSAKKLPPAYDVAECTLLLEALAFYHGIEVNFTELFKMTEEVDHYRELLKEEYIRSFSLDDCQGVDPISIQALALSSYFSSSSSGSKSSNF